MLGKIIRKSLLKNIRITIWTLATLTMCAALVAMFTTISIDVEENMNSSLRNLGANAIVHTQELPEKITPALESFDRKFTLERSEGLEDKLREESVKQRSNWQMVETLAEETGADVLVLSARIGIIEEKALVVVSAESTALARLTPYWIVNGKRDIAPGECLVGKRLANTLNIEVGTAVTVQWPASQKSSNLRVIGIFESGDDDESRLFTSFLDFTSETEMEAVISQLPPGHPNIRDKFMDRRINCLTCHESGKDVNNKRQPRNLKQQPIVNTESDIPPPISTYALLSVPEGEQGILKLAEQFKKADAGVSLKPLRQIIHGEKRVLKKIALLSGLALAAVLLLSALGVSAAILARIVERRQELALFQALGAVRRSVVIFLLCESATVGALASVVGFVLGVLLAQIVVQHVFHVSITPHLTSFLAALTATMGVALLAGVAAARRALRIEPAVALKGE